MNVLTLDFETYYDHVYSLKKLTIPRYVLDPRFRIHGLAVRHPDGLKEFRADVSAALAELQTRFGRNLDRITVLVHNAYFDLYVLRHRFGISVRHFVDTMLLSYHIHGRRGADGGEGASLASLAQHYGLPAKGDLGFMLGVRNPSPAQLADLAVYAQNDVEITFRLATKLLPEISRANVELPIMQHTIRLFTERGVTVDGQELAALRDRIRAQTERWFGVAGVTDEDVSQDGKFVALLGAALKRTGRLLPLKRGARGMIPATAKKDQAMQELLNDADPAVAALARARTGKKSEDQLLAKLDTLAHTVEVTGGVLPVYLVYGGAHTGRFAGGQKFNLQNLGRDGFGLELRRLFRPSVGHLFVVGDLSQVEARITAWYAGEPGLLDAFASGNDIYSAFASETLHEVVHKPLATDPPDTQSRLKSLRQVGKTAVLGLGFGMGALKFMNGLRADALTAPLFGSGMLSPAACFNIVRSFRRRFARIPPFWAALEGAFRLAVRNAVKHVGKLTFEKREDTVLVRLPSGRALRYPQARLEATSRTIRFLDESGGEAERVLQNPSVVYGDHTELYGGKLCENIVQASARDILVEAILRLEAKGLRVLFHVHDEIVLEVPEREAEAARETLLRELKREPEWAKGLPLDAEVAVAACYGK